MKFKLQEIVDVTMGQSPKSEFYNTERKGYPFLQGNRTFGFKHPTFDTYTTVMTKPAKAGDVIMSVRAPVGDLNITPVDMCLGRGVCSLRMKNGNQSFLYYMMKYYVPHLLKKESGTVFGSVNRNDINGLEVDIPGDEQTQRRIARYLEMIDEKIELNNAINNNLEQQAQTLFKSWFVDFEPFDESFIDSPTGTKIPHSLQMVQIGSLPHILETGKRPKGGAVATGVPSIGAENVKRLGEVNFASAKYIPVEFAQKMDKGKVHGYELMLYKDGGKPGTFIPHFSMFGEGFPYDDFFINEHVFKLDFGDKGFNEFCYFYLQTDYPYNWLANNGGKAAVPGINQQDVNSIWIYHPDNPLVKEYCKWVQPIFTTILRNCSQNVKLSQLRDALLPKLMSGELDVSDIEI